MGENAQFQELLDEERRLNAELDDLEGRRKALRQLIREEMDGQKLEKFEAKGWAYAVVAPKAGERFTRAGLVKAGVLPNQIDAAAIPTQPAAYLSIRKAGERDAG